MSAQPIPTGLRLYGELLANGFSRDQIQSMCRSGSLRRVARGGYMAAADHLALPPDQQHVARAAAVLANQSSAAALSYQSAAALIGIDTWSLPFDLVHLNKDGTAGRHREAGVKTHTHRLDPSEVHLVAGMPVTTPSRTVLDIATSASFEQGVVVADSALHRRLTTHEELVSGLTAMVGRHGRRRAEAVVAFADGGSASVGESRSRVLFHNAGLPAPELQHTIRRSDATVIAVLDFWWREHRLAGEFDGFVKYDGLVPVGATPGQVVFREKLREDEVRRQGIAFERWGWVDLFPGTDLVRRLWSHLR